jgi:outer membrane lipoprotein SlyB
MEDGWAGGDGWGGVREDGIGPGQGEDLQTVAPAWALRVVAP